MFAYICIFVCKFVCVFGYKLFKSTCRADLTLSIRVEQKTTEDEGAGETFNTQRFPTRKMAHVSTSADPQLNINHKSFGL